MQWLGKVEIRYFALLKKQKRGSQKVQILNEEELPVQRISSNIWKDVKSLCVKLTEGRKHTTCEV